MHVAEDKVLYMSRRLLCMLVNHQIDASNARAHFCRCPLVFIIMVARMQVIL
jgi:hypothetical protein